VDNRSELLAIALRLFAARGYDAVGVQEIAQSAGVAKPTLYHYFGSKHGLLTALLEEQHAHLLGSLEAAAAAGGDIQPTLDRLLGAYLDCARARPDFYRFWLTLLFAPPDSEAFEPASRLYLGQQALVERVFQEAVRRHGNMRGRHQRYAYTFIGLANGAAALLLSGRRPVTPQLRRDLLHQFSHGIYS